MTDGKPVTRGVIKAKCKCGQSLTFRREHAGKKAKCPGCKAVVKVPAPAMALQEAACKAHPDAKRVAKCMICDAAMCSLCRDARGYYCGDECQTKAQERVEVAEEDLDDERAAATAGRVWAWTKRAIVAAVLLGVGWGVYALVFSTRGKTAWELTLAAREDVRTFLEHDGKLVALTGNGYVVKYDPETGATLGEVNLGGELGWFAGEPTVEGDVLIVSTGRELVAVSLSKMSVLWRGGGGDWTRDAGGVYYIDGSFWMAEEDPEKGPKLVCLDAASGKERWRAPAPKLAGGMEIAAGSGVLVAYASLGVIDPRRPPQGDRLVALDAKTGKPLWKAAGDFKIAAAPAFDSGKVIVPTATGLTAFNPTDGATAWSYVLPGGASVDKGGRVWSIEGKLYYQVGNSLTCLDPAGGKDLWSVDAGGWISELEMIDGKLVITGETVKKLIDVLNEGPTFLAGEAIMKDIVAKEMPNAENAKPYSAVIDPSGPKLLCAVEAGGRATIHDGLLVVAQTRYGMRLNDTSGAAFGSSSTVTGFKLDEGTIVWQEGVPGSIGAARFIGGKLFCVQSIQGKNEEVTVKMTAIHLD